MDYKLKARDFPLNTASVLPSATKPFACKHNLRIHIYSGQDLEFTILDSKLIMPFTNEKIFSKLLDFSKPWSGSLESGYKDTHS